MIDESRLFIGLMSNVTDAGYHHPWGLSCVDVVRKGSSELAGLSTRLLPIAEPRFVVSTRYLFQRDAHSTSLALRMHTHTPFTQFRLSETDPNC